MTTKTTLLLLILFCTSLMSQKSIAQTWIEQSGHNMNFVKKMVIEPGTNHLYVAGSEHIQIGFSFYNYGRLSYFDGLNWYSIPLDTNNWNIFTIDDIDFYQGNIIISGNISPKNSTNSAHAILTYDGKDWSQLGQSLDYIFVGSDNSMELLPHIEVYKNELYLSGCFNDPTTNDTVRFAKWTGNLWQNCIQLSGFINDMEVINDTLYLMGHHKLANGHAWCGLASWDNINYDPIISGTSIKEIQFMGEDIFLIDATWDRNFYRWRNGYLEKMDLMTFQPFHALEVYRNDLYLGGCWEKHHGAPSAHLVTLSLQTGMAPVDNGVNSLVTDMIVYNDMLLIGGLFDTASGIPCQGLIGWGNTNSIPEYETGDLSIYPNPANNQITVSNNNNIKSISIYDLSGKEIIRKEIQSSEQSIIIDIASLVPGSYIIKAISEKGIITSKFIKT